MDRKQIYSDIDDYGLSQWFSSKGLCSVFETEMNVFKLVISVGPTLNNGEVIERHYNLSIDDVIRLSELDN